MSKRYILEIYPPNTVSESLATLESDEPFMSISKGDLINPGFFPQSDVEGILQVVNLEHIIWSKDDSYKHKVCIFTKLVDNSEQARLA